MRGTAVESWNNGVYTLTVKHNGPLDITIKCSGQEKDRLTTYTPASLVEPAFPAAYTGPRQYEAEFFDYKNIKENITNGCQSGVLNYQGQGYMKFGSAENAAVRDNVPNDVQETVNMTLRYATTSDINTLDLYVGGEKVTTLSLPKGESYSDWKTVTCPITLKKGDNKIELKATAKLPADLYLDHFVIE